MLVKLGPIFPKFAGYKIKKKQTILIYIYSQSATHYPLFFFKLNWAPLLWYFHQQLSPVKKPHAMMVESVGVAPGGSWSMKAPDTFGIVPLEFSFQVFLLGKTNIPWIHDLFPYIVLMCFFPFLNKEYEVESLTLEIFSRVKFGKTKKVDVHWIPSTVPIRAVVDSMAVFALWMVTNWGIWKFGKAAFLVTSEWTFPNNLYKM